MNVLTAPWRAYSPTADEFRRFRDEGMTAAEIERELREAFVEADHHGVDCDCCQRLQGRSGHDRQQRRLAADSFIGEAMLAFDRFGPGGIGLADKQRIEDLTWRAAEVARTAARDALVAFTVAELARPATEDAAT